MPDNLPEIVLIDIANFLEDYFPGYKIDYSKFNNHVQIEFLLPRLRDIITIKLSGGDVIVGSRITIPLADPDYKTKILSAVNSLIISSLTEKLEELLTQFSDLKNKLRQSLVD